MVRQDQLGITAKYATADNTVVLERAGRGEFPEHEGVEFVTPRGSDTVVSSGDARWDENRRYGSVRSVLKRDIAL